MAKTIRFNSKFQTMAQYSIRNEKKNNLHSTTLDIV